MADNPFADPQPQPGGGIYPRQHAASANTLGLWAVGLCLVMVCGGCLPALPAFIVGLLATRHARAALAIHTDDELIRHQARNGNILGWMAMLYSGLPLLFMLAYFSLYGLVVGGLMLTK